MFAGLGSRAFSALREQQAMQHPERSEHGHVLHVTELWRDRDDLRRRRHEQLWDAVLCGKLVRLREGLQGQEVLRAAYQAERHLLRDPHQSMRVA